MKDTNFLKKDLHDKDWIGVVINNNDPTFSGRAQVKVFGVMDDLSQEHIPWASPVNNSIYGKSGSGNLSVPKKGTFVRVQFNNGDIYAPEILGIQNIDQNLINKIKDDYEGTHVLAYDADEELSIIYQKANGLMIFLKNSFFQISSDSMISIQYGENVDSLIQLEGDIARIVTKNEVDITASGKVAVNADEVIVKGSQTTKIGNGPYQNAILAQPMWALLNVLADAIDSKLPQTPGVNRGLVEVAKQAATSTNVLISK